MDINKLTQALEIIKLELNKNINSKDELRSVYQTRLAFIQGDLESLIKIINDPEKFKQNRKRCNPDEK
jgi:hypothetical protein